MDGSTRRSRFETRVVLEREFLARVNNKFAISVPLAGMTRAAIDSWVARAAMQVDANWVSDIAALLVEVSTRAELMADNSKDVFEPDRRQRPDSLDELRDLLERALARGEV